MNYNTVYLEKIFLFMIQKECHEMGLISDDTWEEYLKRLKDLAEEHITEGILDEEFWSQMKDAGMNWKF